MRRKSIDIVAENILKERDGNGGIIRQQDGYTVVGNKFRFVRTSNDITTESKQALNYNCMTVLENCADNAKEFIELPTVREIERHIKLAHENPEYKRGAKIVCNVGGICVNVKYLIDAIKAVKDDGGDIVAYTWKNAQGKYSNPLLISTMNFRTHCVVLPVIAKNVTEQPVGTYSFDGIFNSRVVIKEDAE